MATYFAIFHKDEDSAVGVVFPDLPGCFAAGNDYDDAIVKAREALALYAHELKSRGRPLPGPRSFESLYGDADIRNEAAGAPFVGVELADSEGEVVDDLPELRSRPSRQRTR